MKKNLRFFLLLILISSIQIFSQEDWHYTQQLYFPEADSDYVRPFLCKLMEDGKLIVISAKVTDPSAHNAIYFLNPGDTVFNKFIDYDENGDSDTLLGNIGALRGITALDNDLYVVATQPYPKTQPNTVAATYVYRDFDTLQVEKYMWPMSGYGSYNHGGDITSDSILFVGISFGSTFRGYNFSNGWTDVVFGGYIPPPSYEVEPGGPQTGGVDLIRDVAFIPGGDYNLTTTPFYTSRNSYSSTQVTGGIAVWTGGTQRDPGDPANGVAYTGERVIDLDAFLALATEYPSGITVDNDGLLWVAGIDTNRRWVKAFEIDGIVAIPVYDLPSQFSADIQDPNGAPMGSPCDVAISPDGKTAYVIDHWGRTAFVFRKGASSVDTEKIGVFDFSLEQNYPNPFNPSTLIRFNLPESGNVKLIVTDLLGREVVTLVNENLSAGRHTKSFTADNLSSGIYFYTLITDNAKVSKKMLFMK